MFSSSKTDKNTAHQTMSAARSHIPYRRLVRIALMALLTAFVIISQTGCSNKEPVSKTDFCLDTVCELTIYDDEMDESQAEQVINDTYKEIRRYENLLSKTIEGSDIYRINTAAGQPVEVSGETIEVIRQGLEMSRLSGGKFDITIGSVTALWDFKSEKPKAPETDAVEDALTTVDYRKVKIDGNTVTMADPKAQIDLGGIAKGYIADRAGDFMEEQGVKSAIINLGGNVVVLGQKTEEEQWNIGIERPYSDRTEIIGSVRVSDATLVTSGVYERKFEEGGVLYHHIIDPAVGFPADSDIEAITIAAAKGSSGFCDGLSTACLILGSDGAMELIKQIQQEYPELGLEAAMIDKNDNIVQTDGMKLELLEE